MSDDIMFIDESANLSDRDVKRLNRIIERHKHIGKPGFIGHLRYLWAKRRGRVQGEFYLRSK